MYLGRDFHEPHYLNNLFVIKPMQQIIENKPSMKSFALKIDLQVIYIFGIVLTHANNK